MSHGKSINRRGEYEILVGATSPVQGIIIAHEKEGKMKFEKIRQIKKGKHAITAGCLALGVVMLTSSVYASLDDANGYQNYKEAVKKLAFYTDNATTEVKATAIIDGEEFANSSTIFAVDGENRYEKITDDGLQSNQNGYGNLTIVEGSKKYNINLEDKTYSIYDKSDYKRGGILGTGFDTEDPTQKKMIRFAELLGDAFVGDMKNNVVLESKKDGIKKYTVRLSEVQIPEVINAGVAVAFSAMGDTYHGDYVDTRYIDYDKTRQNFYKEKTGKTLPENYYQRDDVDDIDAVLDELYAKEDAAKKDHKGGILIVREDASMEYYSSIKKALADPANDKAFNSNDRLRKYVGGDAWIKSGTNDFEIDDNGNLVSSKGKVVIICKDKNGAEHEIVIKVNMKITDYGTTKLELPDLTKFKDYSDEKMKDAATIEEKAAIDDSEDKAESKVKTDKETV